MSFWESIQSDLQLFRYEGKPITQTLRECPPILMLHGTLSSHQSWKMLADQFWMYGLDSLYALDLPEIQTGQRFDQTYQQIAQTIDLLLNERHMDVAEVVIIGHGAGGIAGYRYWQHHDDRARISYLFMLGAPHSQTSFPLMPEQIVRGDPSTSPTSEKITYTPAVDFSKIKALQGPSSTVLINIWGDRVSPDFHGVAGGWRSTLTVEGVMMQAVGPTDDGIVRGLNLPEAINMTVPLRTRLGHKDLNKDSRVGETILACLRGEYYQVKLKLVGMRLRGEDGDGYSGPVAFEINGNRMPPDSVFHGLTERLYLFEEHVLPICTLGFSVESYSGTITLHLKDLSEQLGRRRRMYTRLHIPLRDSDSTTHTMQDSEGSDFIWRVVCQRMPVILHDPLAPDKSKPVTRGI